MLIKRTETHYSHRETGIVKNVRNVESGGQEPREVTGVDQECCSSECETGRNTRELNHPECEKHHYNPLGGSHRRSPPVSILGTGMMDYCIPSSMRGEQTAQHCSPRDQQCSTPVTGPPDLSLSAKSVKPGTYEGCLSGINHNERMAGEWTALCAEAPNHRGNIRDYPVCIRSFTLFSRENRSNSAQRFLLTLTHLTP